MIKTIKSDDFVYDALRVCVAGKFKKLRMFRLENTVMNYRWTVKELLYFEKQVNKLLQENGVKQEIKDGKEQLRTAGY